MDKVNFFLKYRKMESPYKVERGKSNIAMKKSEAMMLPHLGKWRNRTLNSGQSPGLLTKNRKNGRDDYINIYDQSGGKLKQFSANDFYLFREVGIQESGEEGVKM